MESNNYYLDILKSSLFSIGYSISSKQEEKIILYINLYKKWQEKINLSSIHHPFNIITKHFLDSIYPIILCPSFQKNRHKKIIDLGSGNGFPGIAIKIFYPDLSLDLAEVTSKKILFLSHLIEKLNFKDIQIINSSIQKIPKKYSILITRAFGSIHKIIKESKKYLKKYSLLYIYKGKKEKIQKELTCIPCKIKKSIVYYPYTIPFLEQEERYFIQLSL